MAHFAKIGMNGKVIAVLIEEVSQLTAEYVCPNPVCVPLFVIVAPAGIVIVSPLSPN